MRRQVTALLFLAAVVAAPAVARAEPDVGVGLFLGEPTGVTLKLDLEHRTSLELLLGIESIDEGHGRGGYAHLEFLATLAVLQGESVAVPIRLGIGGALYDDAGASFGSNVAVAARAPLQLALQFRHTQIELYLEIAANLELVDPDNDRRLLAVDGGLGFRIYF